MRAPFLTMESDEPHRFLYSPATFPELPTRSHRRGGMDRMALQGLPLPSPGGSTMSARANRRDFLRTAAAGSLVGLGDLAFLSRLRPVTADESRLDPKLVELESRI